jgi:hypothetical protein
LLSKQRGFLDELLLVTPGKEGVGAKSQWETRERAEIRIREWYPRLMEIVDKFDVGFLTAEVEKAEYSTPTQLPLRQRIDCAIPFRGGGGEIVRPLFLFAGS